MSKKRVIKQYGGVNIQICSDESLRVQTGEKKDSANGFGREIKSVPVWSRWYSIPGELDEVLKDFPQIGRGMFSDYVAEMPRTTYGDTSLIDFDGVPVRQKTVNGQKFFNAEDVENLLGIRFLGDYSHPDAQVEVLESEDLMKFNELGLANFILKAAFFFEVETPEGSQRNVQRLIDSLTEAGVADSQIDEWMDLARFDADVCRQIVETIASQIKIYRLNNDGQFPPFN
jgi:hypothetical protein